jgi:YD repeat-containing protein
LPTTITDRGESTTLGYDYRQRMLTKTVQPRVGTTLTNTSTYVSNLLFSQQDPFGRLRYYAYRSSDGALIRQIQGTVPSFTLANFTAVTNQTRAAGSNALYLITDYTLDNNGRQTAIFDGNNNQRAQSFDSRGQITQVVEASGTGIAAKTAFSYDPEGNRTAIQPPRYFDPNDPQTGKCQATMTYTGRNLLASKTVAPGTAVAATTQFTYDLDQTRATVVDPRNNTWTTLWSACCAGRTSGELDPLSGGTSLEYDYAGNLTYSQVLQGTTVYNYVTTQFDPRGRPSFRTVWLVAPPAVDPTNPPIAGQNGVPAANGLTTQWVYDENLADNVGLSAAVGQNIPGVGSVSIVPLLNELAADGITYGTGSDGFAALEIKPDGELAVGIADGLRRSVGGGTIQPPNGQNPNQPITWHVRLDDTVVSITGFGNALETAFIDALDNTDRRRTDGGGRTIQSLDALNNVSAFTSDANSNRLSASDPNSVGYTAVFDARDRETSRTDTAGATFQTQFDANSNVVKTIDAKNNIATATFDPRDRRSSSTDRINGVTSWSLDANSNLISVSDSESRTTSYQYDQRNLKTSETFADNNPPTVNDQRTFAYDGAKRLQTLTAQTGDYVTYVYDQANRVTSRQYRDHTKQPTDPPNDTDSMTFDGASHLLTAASGRYNNTVTFSYDQAGRRASESLTVGGQTYTATRGYNATGRLTSLTYPDGSVVGQSVTARNQIQQVTYQGNTVASFTYDNGRRMATRVLGDTPGTTTTWAYVTGDNLISSVTTPNLPGFTYAYDTNKNKTSEAITGALQPCGFSTGTSGYDNSNRLVAWNRSDGNRNQSWTLTNVGDWQQFVDAGSTHNRTHNSVHELTASDGTALGYDAKGNLTSNGVTGALLTWDFDNQLKQVVVGSATTSFTYDALRRRVASQGTVGRIS